jgi:Helix-turn-helix domain
MVRLVVTADLLLHPVRLRIVQAFLGERTLTTAELGSELSDVPTASLYRHVGLLADAGVLEVVGERKVRGAAERSYRLVLAAASLDAQSAAAMTADEHRRAFATFVAGLMADFDRYLERVPEGRTPDLAGDRVGYRQAAVWLTDEEFDAMVLDLAAVLQERLAQRPDGARRRRLVTVVHLPGD